jgi:hypothetical protein
MSTRQRTIANGRNWPSGIHYNQLAPRAPSPNQQSECRRNMEKVAPVEAAMPDALPAFVATKPATPFEPSPLPLN